MILLEERTHKDGSSLFGTYITEDAEEEQPYVFLPEQRQVGVFRTAFLIFFQLDFRETGQPYGNQHHQQQQREYPVKRYPRQIGRGDTCQQVDEKVPAFRVYVRIEFVNEVRIYQRAQERSDAEYELGHFRHESIVFFAAYNALQRV